MNAPYTPAREERLRAARRSPELANLHDETAWLALYSENAVVEDPVGSPPCQRGVFTRPGRGKDDLERFYATFIAPCEIRVEEIRDVVVDDTVVRDVVLHVKLTGGGHAAIPAVLRYDLVPRNGELKVARMRAYWDAGRNGRQLLAQGWRGKLTSILSGLRLVRVLGKDWAGRYIAGTKRGIRRDGAVAAAAIVDALKRGDATALDALCTPGATATLAGAATTPLRSLDGAALDLELETPISAGYTTALRCRALVEGVHAEGIAFLEFEASSGKIEALTTYWER